jgi:hypothetical protein
MLKAGGHGHGEGQKKEEPEWSYGPGWKLKRRKSRSLSIRLVFAQSELIMMQSFCAVDYIDQCSIGPVLRVSQFH